MRVLLLDLNPFMPPVTPISLGNLAAVLQAQGHDVRVLSLGSTSRFSPAGLRSYVMEIAPDLVGFGTYQRNLRHVRAAAGLIKAVAPSTAVVIGGPQATFLPEAALLAMPEIDFVSRGEGELAIAALAQALAGGARSDEPIAGITARLGDGSCITGPSPAPPTDLDEYPSPWLSGILDPAQLPESIMLTSRGCCNSCSFCYTPAAFGRHIRCQSVERVVADIAYVARRGSGRLWFADPNFSFDESRVRQILAGIIARDLKVEMWIETRADMLTPSLISLLKRAGVTCVAMGLESASPNVYPRLHKSLEPERIRQAVQDARRAGLAVELFSQYALPGETLADALSTLQFVKDCQVPIRGNSNAQQMQLYFGSEIQKSYDRYGVRPLRDSFPPYLAIGTQFETDWLTAAEIKQVKARWRAESQDGGKRIVS